MLRKFTKLQHHHLKSAFEKAIQYVVLYVEIKILDNGFESSDLFPLTMLAMAAGLFDLWSSSSPTSDDHCSTINIDVDSNLTPSIVFKMLIIV